MMSSSTPMNRWLWSRRIVIGLAVMLVVAINLMAAQPLRYANPAWGKGRQHAVGSDDVSVYTFDPHNLAPAIHVMEMRRDTYRDTGQRVNVYVENSYDANILNSNEHIRVMDLAHMTLQIVAVAIGLNLMLLLMEWLVSRNAKKGTEGI